MLRVVWNYYSRILETGQFINCSSDASFDLRPPVHGQVAWPLAKWFKFSEIKPFWRSSVDSDLFSFNQLLFFQPRWSVCRESVRGAFAVAGDRRIPQLHLPLRHLLDKGALFRTRWGLLRAANFDLWSLYFFIAKNTSLLHLCDASMEKQYQAVRT